MSNQYGSIPSEEVQKLLAEKGAAVYAMGQQKLVELRDYADNGNWTWKICGFLAGLLIIANSVLSFVFHLTGLSPFVAIIDIYLMMFGVVACLLEYKEKLFTQKYLNLIKREALFLYRPYGRAAFYAFVGLLIVSTGGFFGLFIGLYTLLVGLLIYHGSRNAVASLNQLKEAKMDEHEIAKKFKEFDSDNSGSLDTKELAALCQSLGSRLSLNDLEAAVFLLDKNDNGKIEYAEFIEWWKGKDDGFV